MRGYVKNAAQLCFLLLVFAELAQAVGFGVGGGMAYPYTPANFDTYWNAGPTLELSVASPVVTWLGLVGCLSYSSFPFDEATARKPYDLGLMDLYYDGYDTDIVFNETGMSVLCASILAKAQQHLFGRFSVYAFGGPNFVRRSVEIDAEVFVDDPIFAYFPELAELPAAWKTEQDYGFESVETVLGLRLGVGFEVEIIRGIGLFVQGDYSVAFTEGNSTESFPLQIGLRTQ